MALRARHLRRRALTAGSRGRLAVGAHVSSAGGVHHAVARAVEREARSLQIWVDQPQRFPRAPLPEDDLAKLREGLAAHGLVGVVHAPYLINLATPDRRLRGLSVDMLSRALRAAKLGGLAGAVVHVGSHLGRGYEDVRAAVVRNAVEAAARADAADLLVVENTAGAGGSIGADLDELRDLLDELQDAGLAARVCIDTQHAHAAGADLSTEEGVARYAAALRASGLAGRVALVHANDSRSASGSRRDLHANPGAGTIGATGLRALSRVPELAAVPWVLEVPGPERHGPTLAEVRRMREIAE